MSESSKKEVRQQVEKEVRKAEKAIVARAVTSLCNRFTCFSRWDRLKICWWVFWRKPKRILWNLLNNKKIRFKNLDDFIENNMKKDKTGVKRK